MKNNLIHAAIAAVLVVLLGALTDPFMLWMPPRAAMSVLVFAAVLLAVWAGFVMFEQKGDEREEAHRMHADRIAYLCGVGVLTAALVAQGAFAHRIDIFVSAALAAMVLSKLAARIWAQLRG